MYWPAAEIDPAPSTASPPLTAQFTEAAPPPLRVAENCSTDAPELLVALHPVQLVSMVAVPGETANVPFDEPPDADPPQPASKTRIGTAPAASIRAGQRPKTFDTCRGKRFPARLPREGNAGLCGSVVTAAPLLNLPGRLSGQFSCSMLIRRPAQLSSGVSEFSLPQAPALAPEPTNTTSPCHPILDPRCTVKVVLRCSHN